MTPALEAFCLRQPAVLPLWRMAERRKPRRSIFINQRGCLHTKHMQISLLPVARQGKEADETTAKCAYLVRINRLYHTINIHAPYTKIAMRNSL